MDLLYSITRSGCGCDDGWHSSSCFASAFDCLLCLLVTPLLLMKVRLVRPGQSLPLTISIIRWLHFKLVASRIDRLQPHDGNLIVTGIKRRIELNDNKYDWFLFAFHLHRHRNNPPAKAKERRRGEHEPRRRHHWSDKNLIENKLINPSFDVVFVAGLSSSGDVREHEETQTRHPHQTKLINFTTAGEKDIVVFVLRTVLSWLLRIALTIHRRVSLITR